jgi:O-succinylbenzoate synthase
MAKVRVTLKDPDGVYDSIREAAKESVAEIKGLGEDERESLVEARSSTISDAIKAWVEHGEYVTVEFDTVTKKARVVPVKE